MVLISEIHALYGLFEFHCANVCTYMQYSKQKEMPLAAGSLFSHFLN